MRKTYLYLALILFPLWAKAGELTLVIAVQGADSAALRTISNEGEVQSLHYDTYNYHAVLASALTGVTPSIHGVCSDSVFNRDTHQLVSLFISNNDLHIATPVSYDCEALLSPTIADQLRLQLGNATRIYAIGQQPSTALLLAGKAANACCWIEPRNNARSGVWASTSYYREGLPSEADRMNVNGELDRLITPKNGFDAAVFALATAMQKDKHLGTRSNHDMLLVQLQHTSSVWGLIEAIGRQVNQQHLHVLVIGLPAPVDDKQQELRSKWNMQPKQFNLDRALALTSSYLMALYGYERWIDGGYGNNIYLNRMLIQANDLPLDRIRHQVAEFLMEFDGVRYACPIDQAYLQSPMRENIHKRFAGDVIFDLQPNYQPIYTTGAILKVNF